MLKKIASFTINHDTLTPGMYVSRIDGDCVTYDLRLKFPNQGDYVAQPALHTLEHLIVTFVRSSTASEQGGVFRADGLPDGVLPHPPRQHEQGGRFAACARRIPFRGGF